MLKGLYSWHIKQRRFKLSKSSFFSPLNAVKKPFKFFNRKPYYFASEDQYVYEKPASRHFFRYLFLALAFVLFIIWFLLECYRGWSVFTL